MTIGDRAPALWRRWTKKRGPMEEPLHTDDPYAVGNLSAVEYRRAWELRAAELGDAGLHVVPASVLDAIGGDEDGAGRE